LRDGGIEKEELIKYKWKGEGSESTTGGAGQRKKEIIGR
jgi:hypothetical protein